MYPLLVPIADELSQDATYLDLNQQRALLAKTEDTHSTPDVPSLTTMAERHPELSEQRAQLGFMEVLSTSDNLLTAREHQVSMFILPHTRNMIENTFKYVEEQTMKLVSQVPFLRGVIEMTNWGNLILSIGKGSTEETYLTALKYLYSANKAQQSTLTR